ncbi:MAG: hypothetical protein AB7S38_31255 [Vulcanimicrobiota bacterium]
MRIASTPAVEFAGKRYTIDTFPEDPEGETHELALLELGEDTFTLEGEIYGANYRGAHGNYSLEDGVLKLRPENGSEIAIAVGDHDPEYFWPGRDIDIHGLPQWEGQQITFHRVPDPEAFAGELNHHEHNLVGEHKFTSPRMGEFSMLLHPDRSAEIDGQLQGKEVHWKGQWLSTYPMSYFVIDGGNGDFLSWHNNHDHGNHDHHHQPDPVQKLIDMPVDVIVTTTGDDADIRKVYGMVMNPSEPAAPARG